MIRIGTPDGWVGEWDSSKYDVTNEAGVLSVWRRDSVAPAVETFPPGEWRSLTIDGKLIKGGRQ